MPSISEPRSSVICGRAASSYTPDYFVEHAADQPWIHQPFEEYDELGPEGPGAQEVRHLTVTKKAQLPALAFVIIFVPRKGLEPHGVTRCT